LDSGSALDVLTEECLSIPLGELDFLGHYELSGRVNQLEDSFNSPWGIRFPWTPSLANLTFNSRCLSIPLGELDFLGQILKRGERNGLSLSIPLGELDFLGRTKGSRGKEESGRLSIPLGELDFLGLEQPKKPKKPPLSFNSPWGIRFPWTLQPLAELFKLIVFQFPLGN